MMEKNVRCLSRLNFEWHMHSNEQPTNTCCLPLFIHWLFIWMCAHSIPCDISKLLWVNVWVCVCARVCVEKIFLESRPNVSAHWRVCHDVSQCMRACASARHMYINATVWLFACVCMLWPYERALYDLACSITVFGYTRIVILIYIYITWICRAEIYVIYI